MHPPASLRIGIDIGGTHTDAVLIDGSRLIAAAKTATNSENLLASICQTLGDILAGQNPALVRTINLSTTLSTNAIITGTTEPVGVLVSGGPGIASKNYRIGAHYHSIYGSLDHLGTETQALDEQDMEEALTSLREQGLRVFAAVGKFSPRNPAHENQMQEQIREHLGEQADYVALGHLVAGQLNFGRRIHTAYYNAAVWRSFHTFATAFRESLAGYALDQAEINILKADGGTMPLARALDAPVQSIFSGPAASVMGVLASRRTEHDALMLDIGGTTSDIALFASGEPLLEREGIAIEGRPTLVRALHVESIGMGGDSLLRFDASQTLCVGPQRLGPCMAAGGAAPTLMDALNVAGLAAFGAVQASRDGLALLAAEHSMDATEVAAQAIDSALRSIAAKIAALIQMVNSKPVYTIHEILAKQAIRPKQLIVIGGPAAVFQQLLADRLGLEVIVPPLHSVANAIGAALTRSTSFLSLTANTARGRLSVPMLDIFRSIPKGYSLQDATDEAKRLLLADLAHAGVHLSDTDIQIIQAESFNMVEGSYTSGKNIRVVAQVRPAVVAHLEGEYDLTK
jgi:N-methylhydantoinase A/oxoprolinase/acetone carboxylase beta subunit